MVRIVIMIEPLNLRERIIDALDWLLGKPQELPKFPMSKALGRSDEPDSGWYRLRLKADGTVEKVFEPWRPSADGGALPVVEKGPYRVYEFRAARRLDEVKTA